MNIEQNQSVVTALRFVAYIIFLLTFATHSVTSQSTDQPSWLLKYYAPTGRCCHLLLADTNTTALAAFGRGDSDRDLFNDMWRFNVTNKVWTQLHPEGGSPSARRYPCGVVLNGSMYVYGGRSADGRVLNDLWVYNIARPSWRLIQQGEGLWPPSQWKCTIVPTGPGFAMVFGITLRTQYEFNLATKTWSVIPKSIPDPAPRASTCCSQSPTDPMNTLCHAGSRVPDQVDLQDMWQFNGTTRRWSNVSYLAANGPSARSYHMCFYGLKYFYVYSGWVNDIQGHPLDLWQLDFDLKQWTKFDVSTDATLVDSSQIAWVSPSYTFMWGGWGEVNPGASVHLEFNELTGNVNVLRSDTIVPRGRFGACVFTFSESVILAFGAISGTGVQYVYPEDTAWYLRPTITRLNAFAGIPSRVGAQAFVRGVQVLFF
eukprot:PhF_6_TR43017/c0_g1_i5/m.65763